MPFVATKQLTEEGGRGEPEVPQKAREPDPQR